MMKEGGKTSMIVKGAGGDGCLGWTTTRKSRIADGSMGMLSIYCGRSMGMAKYQRSAVVKLLVGAACGAGGS
jgi:hypothetical protein